MPYEIDTAHSQVVFAVRHMMISTVRGNFRSFRGTLNITPDDPASSWVEAEVDVNSVTTHDESRDGHLRGPEFFDAEKYPTLTFKSNTVMPQGGDKYKVQGDMTMHGITRQITFDISFGGIGKDPWGNMRAGVNVHGKISRKEWGLNWNQALETGGLLVSDEVRIEMELEAVLKP